MAEIMVKLEKNSADDVYVLSENNIHKYFNKSGIWILLGMAFDDDKFVSLNVGKSKAMGQEILYDISCLNHLKISDDGERDYINQFGESCKFKWNTGLTQEYLYPNLAKIYKKLLFIKVVDAGKNDTDTELRAKEKVLAEKYHALYWRNGKVYDKVVYDEFQDDQMVYFETVEDFLGSVE